jgi:co-chaperonin GroES (HSP10)
MKVKKIKPLFNSIVTTMDKYEEDVTNNGVIDASKTEGTLKEYQTVLSVGTTVRDIKVGDVVMINPRNYAVRKYSENSIKNDIDMNPVITYNFNIVEMDGKQCLLLQDRDIDYIIEEYEEDKKPSAIIQPKPKKIII